MSRVKLLALVCAALLLVSCSAGKGKVNIKDDGTLELKVTSSGVSEPQPDPDGYILAAQNDKFTLYFEKKGLTVRMKNNLTGEIMQSAATPDEGSSETWKNFVNSGLVLEYFKGEAVNINKTNMYSGKPVTKVTLIKNGFAAEISFKSIGISLNLFVTLCDEGLRVQIPSSSIKEENEQFKLAAIYVMPFLGYTKLGEVEGYMLIPDGSGAIIELKDNNEKFSQPYKARIYGGNYSVEANTAAVQKYDDDIATIADTAGVFAPVFGMVHTENKNAFVGVIESGKFNSEIYAYPNGVITDYNWITPRYVYREVYQYLTGQSGSITSSQEKRETFDISTVYLFASGDDADYVGLAKAYRKYLTDNKLLAESEEDFGIRLDFFAGDVEKALIGKRYVSMTTVEQIDTVLDSLTKKGVKSLSVSLKGWQKNGIYGELSSKLRFEGAVGSMSDYSNLAKKYSSSAQFMLYGDFLNTYKKTGAKDYIYQYNGKAFSNETFLELHPTKYRYIPDVAEENISQMTSRLEKYDNIGISFDGVTSEVYSYSSGEKMSMFSRQYAAENIIGSLKDSASKVNTAYISPNDYLWADMQKYYDFRVYGSDYKFVTREVPFFSIVLSGSVPLYSEYVNFKADTTEYRLKLIENGVYPSFLLTFKSPSELIYTDSASLFSCEYGEYSEMITEYYDTFSKLAKAVDKGRITEHSFENGIGVTTYENGTAVVVNYNKTDVQYESNSIKAQSYCILDRGAVQK